MALIPIGNSEDLPVGQNPAVQIPTVITPPTAVVVLGNTRLIETSPVGGDTADTHWYRNTSDVLHPNFLSDHVVVGSNVRVSDERFRVAGNANITRLRIENDATVIYRSGNDMLFTDGNNSPITLTQLATSGTTAAGTSVADTDSNYSVTPKNVETVLAYIATQLDTIPDFTEAQIALLKTYAQTEAHLADAVGLMHNAASITEGTGLHINDQLITLDTASSTTTGSLLSTDWVIFNDKLDTTDTLDAIKDLTLADGSLIVGTSSTTAETLVIGNANQILAVNAFGDSLTWVDNEGGAGGSMFEVPGSYDAIVNEIGDINNTKYPDVEDLEELSLLEILQGMLFPVPLAPDFIKPSTSITVTGVTSTGNYVEKGSTFSTTISRTFTSSPAHAVESAVRYLLGASTFTPNPSNVYFNVNRTFNTESDYIADSSFTYQLPSGGAPITPDQFLNYPPDGSRTIISSRTFTVVDPIYYGAITTSSTTYPTAPTEANVKTATKLIGPEPTSPLTIIVPTYTGAVDTKKFILIAYPDSYGSLSQVLYAQGGNANVLGSFNSTTFTYTEPDLSTTVTYRLYYALNSYNSGGSVTYTIYF